MGKRGFFAFFIWLAIGIFMTIGGCQMLKASSNTLTVSAAISLTDALENIKSLYRQNHQNITITYNFGASGSLQQQIKQGAPVDIFISAASKQMDALQQNNLLSSDTRTNLLLNSLVLITSNNNYTISNFQALINPKVKRIA
ncbi:MAG TPA: molybdate ABC transporter substrate-binding protein, partial [Candidatus Obscuribacterales bacterium]